MHRRGGAQMDRGGELVAGLVCYFLQAETGTSFVQAVYYHRVRPGCLGVHLEHSRQPKNMRLWRDDHVFGSPVIDALMSSQRLQGSG